MSNFLTGGGRVSVTLTATQKIAVASQGAVQVYRTSGFVNYPDASTLIGTVINGQTVFGTFTGGATIIIDAGGGLSAQYEIGTDPNVKQWRTDNGVQGDVTAKTVAVTLTSAELLTTIITGTHTAGATAAYTLPTGTLLDAASSFDVNEYFDWSLLNLSAATADTITLTSPGASHTIVGNAIVQSANASTGGIYGNSARWRTRKTAAATFVTYRIA
jgi:hypothetical protein